MRSTLRQLGAATDGRPPPAPDDVARWLLNQEAGHAPTPDGLAAAADRIYVHLRASLVDVFGPAGFDALWARAMVLVHGTPPPGVRDAAAPPVRLPPGVPAAVLDQDPVTAHAALATTFASFITLLFTFVGPPLGIGLIGQQWPALLVREPDPQTGERTE